MLICKYCGKEIHKAVHALFVNTELSSEIMPEIMSEINSSEIVDRWSMWHGISAKP
nr:hypothetical protein [Candidatus Sigynarchaeota archaeon]